MPTSADAKPTQALLSFISSLKLSDIPVRTRERAKDLVLDHLGVTLYGATLEWSRIVREQVGDEGGTPESTIYGGKRVPARSAALINGAAAHGIELDDTHDESLGHPGCVIIPAALAVAESTKASGADFLAAMIGGYEAQCRIGAVTGDALIQRGFHPTAQNGVFGATAAAGRVYSLDLDRHTRAFGIAASMSSGVMKFTQDPEGTMIKRLHAGMPAERGILAAKLARGGFTGPREAIEGTYGFASVFAHKTDLARITRDLGETFEIDSISVKLYPCCRMFHSLIEAIGECRATSGFSADQIETIETAGPRNMIDGHLERRPRSSMAAQYSLPYTTAVATLIDATQPSSFDQAMMTRSDLLALADKVKPTLAPDLEALFPKKFSSRVTFTMKDGRKFESTMLDSRSTPEKPIGRADIHAKFIAVTSGLLAPRQQDAIVDAVLSLDRAPTVEHLTTLLGADALHGREPVRQTA